MKSNEYIIRICGKFGTYHHYRGETSIASLSIHTNFCPTGYGPYGLAQECDDLTKFSTQLLTNDDGYTIYGREHNYLGSIGISARKMGNRIATQIISFQKKSRISSSQSIFQERGVSEQVTLEAGQQKEVDPRDPLSFEPKTLTNIRTPSSLVSEKGKEKEVSMHHEKGNLTEKGDNEDVKGSAHDSLNKIDDKEVALPFHFGDLRNMIDYLYDEFVDRNIEKSMLQHEKDLEAIVSSEEECSDFFRGHKPTMNLIQVFIRLLNKKINQSGYDVKLGWLDPYKTRDDQSLNIIEDYILTSIKNCIQQKCEVIIAPYLQGEHWLLLMFAPSYHTVYVFHSITQNLEPELSIKNVVNCLWEKITSEGLQQWKNLKWKYCKCPRNYDGMARGYYVMKKMHDIVACFLGEIEVDKIFDDEKEESAETEQEIYEVLMRIGIFILSVGQLKLPQTGLSFDLVLAKSRHWKAQQHLSDDD